MKSLFCIAALVALTGCAQLGAADCGPDWYGIGRRDGTLGAQPQVEAYARRCGVEVDRESYRRGWEEGIYLRPRPAA